LQSPTLTIVAGCNGSGKSSFSRMNVKGVQPFDYDKRYLEIYSSLYDSEFRDQFAKQKATQEFESSIEGAFSHGKDFCYETNFDTHPIEYAVEAKRLGYELRLIFYCLDSIEIAQKRVAIRTDNNGHFVRNDVIEYKWHEGYKNLNLHFQIFDFIQLLDNSKHNSIPTNVFSLTKNDTGAFDVESYVEEIPPYAQRRYPRIHNLLLNY